ncbi:Uncharacterised protein [uncultured archaeon]|nr:Uncharacterised protein [uncultured archaeon]
MKKSLFIAAFTILILISISGLSLADYGTTASIAVSVAKYEPFPAEAGQYVDVWFKVENLGSGDSGNVTLQLLPKFPFSLESDDAVKSTGPISSGSTPLIKYHIKIDEKATAGDNILQIRYRPNSFAPWTTQDVDIFIQAHDAVLAVSQISSEDMIPGKTQNLSLSLENMADTYLRDVAVTLDFSASTLPFATIDSVNEKRTSGIAPKEKQDVLFGIITFPDATSGVYKIPVALKYSDITNKTYNRTYLLGLVVNSAPDFKMDLQKYDVMTEGSTGTLTASVSNTGPGAIKFMTMDLLPSAAYEVIGEDSIYLGNLNPDDYQTGAIKKHVNKGALSGGKTVPLNIALKYRDGLNNEYSKNTTLDMRVYTPSEISAYGLGPSGSSYTIIYVLIAIAVIYYVYRRYFRRKKST